MIKAINAILAVICIVLAFFLYKSINDPIKYQTEIEERNQAVYNQLYKIRDAQNAFKSVNGEFAQNFDTLKKVMKTGKYESINQITNDTTRVNILDSIFKGDISSIENLDKVPGSNGATFEMGAGVLPNPNDSLSYIPVFEASTQSGTYLDGINKNYWRDKKVKIGSLTAPILTGNWQ